MMAVALAGPMPLICSSAAASAVLMSTDCAATAINGNNRSRVSQVLRSKAFMVFSFYSGLCVRHFPYVAQCPGLEKNGEMVISDKPVKVPLLPVRRLSRCFYCPYREGFHPRFLHDEAA